MVDDGLRLIRGLAVGHVGGGDSRPAACSATGALLRVTILGRVTTSIAQSAHHRGVTGSTATGGPSGRAVSIASTVATDLAVEPG